MMFKGFKQMDLITTNPLLLIAILSEELARTNTALEAVSEELKNLKKNKFQSLPYISRGGYTTPPIWLLHQTTL